MRGIMLRAASLLVVALLLNAQQAADNPKPADPVAQKAQETAKKLRADVLHLLEVDGSKERMQANLKVMLEQGKAKMIEVVPESAGSFADEWVRRMTARIKVDDFLEVVAPVYEKYFNDEEILRIIAFIEARKKSPDAVLDSALLEKIKSNAISIQSEIMGATTQFGAKIGGEVGMEIEKEHPEYTKKKQ
jgi:hypothetical protein